MSTAVEQPRRDDTKFVPPKPPPQNWQLHDEVSEQRSRDVLVMLLAIRTLNAFTLGTFFQPDEFYQALEPAWALAFGPQSGAWLTWVCIYSVLCTDIRTDNHTGVDPSTTLVCLSRLTRPPIPPRLWSKLCPWLSCDATGTASVAGAQGYTCALRSHHGLFHVGAGGTSIREG